MRRCLHEFPHKKRVRRQIHFKGRKNQLKELNTFIGKDYFRCAKPYITFIKPNLLNLCSWNDANEAYNATTIALDILSDYAESGEDEIFSYFWTLFGEYVQYGDESVMKELNAVLWFITYPEEPSGEEYNLEMYPKFKSMARYHSHTEYPSTYRMLFDCLNAWDIRVTDSLTILKLDEYKEVYLSKVPYRTNDYKAVWRVTKDAINRVVHLLKQHKGKLKRIQDIIDNGIPFRLGDVSNAQCAAGTKNYDFFVAVYVTGVQSKTYEYIETDINIINTLYKINLPMPKINENGMKPEEYHTKFRILPDPKKARYAYMSNPFKDLIGYIGMDIIEIILSVMPWVRVSRKRSNIQDMVDDKSRYTDICKCIEAAKEYDIVLQNTDLSKATENQNIDCEIYILYQILTKSGIRVSQEYLEMTLGQLGRMPITLDYPDGRDSNVYYCRRGQCQGVPGSFHIMTLTLAVINWQSAYDVLHKKYRYDKLCKMLDKMLQNNGDDGSNVEEAEARYKSKLKVLADPDGIWDGCKEVEEVFNSAKANSFSLNNSLEFCKTYVFDNNRELISGYRLNTIWQAIRGLKNIRHLFHPNFSHELGIIKDLLPLYKEYTDGLEDKYHRIAVLEKLFSSEDIDKELERVDQLIQDDLMFRLSKYEMMDDARRTILYGLDDLIEDTEVRKVLPRNRAFYVSEGGLLAIADLQKLESVLYITHNEGCDVTIEEAYLKPATKGREWDREYSSYRKMVTHDTAVINEEKSYSLDIYNIPETMSEFLGCSTLVVSHKYDQHVVIDEITRSKANDFKKAKLMEVNEVEFTKQTIIEHINQFNKVEVQHTVES